MRKCLQNLEWPQVKVVKVLSFELFQKTCFQTPAGRYLVHPVPLAKFLKEHFKSFLYSWGSLGPKIVRVFLSG